MMTKPINISDEEFARWQEAKEKVIQLLKSYNLSYGVAHRILMEVEECIVGDAMSQTFGGEENGDSLD